MRKTLTNPVFLVCLTLATLNQVLEKIFEIFIPIVHSYLDDLLCFSIVLTLGLAMYQYFKPDYQLTPWHMWPVLIVYALYFEVYLPTIYNAFTSDILDVGMYLSGLMVFSYFINRDDAVGLVSNL